MVWSRQKTREKERREREAEIGRERLRERSPCFHKKTPEEQIKKEHMKLDREEGDCVCEGGFSMCNIHLSGVTGPNIFVSDGKLILQY